MTKGKLILFSLLGVAALALGGIGLSYVGAGVKVATAPARVIGKTFDTNNIIAKYEWYHDAWGSWNAQVRNVQSHSSLIKEAKDDGDKNEVSRLRVEVSGMKMVCRDLAEQYNANSRKINQNIFKGKSAPATLNLASCG